jgi:hypothetical protein
MATARHPEDHIRYEQILQTTRDADGVCHRDEAVKLLAEELQKHSDRATEFARSRATQVANSFDNSHQPETENGQMALDVDTYLVIGDSERVTVDRAMAVHTRQWLAVQASNHARQAAAWAAKDQHGRRLLAIQDEHKCSMWKAEQILRQGK